jgi:hypothetical protein
MRKESARKIEREEGIGSKEKWGKHALGKIEKHSKHMHDHWSHHQ